MKTIHEVAPKLTRFITENNPGPEIMDVTEIGCPMLAKFNPEKSKEWNTLWRCGCIWQWRRYVFLSHKPRPEQR